MADLHATFGSKAMAAIGAIAKALPLDYFGVDCTLTDDGRLFLFEANASMLVHLYDSREDFPYKHVYVPRIIAAFEQMVAERASSHRS